MITALLACVHTPPHPPPAEPVRVEHVWREELADLEGRTCRWEEEQLVVGPRRVIGGEPPDATDWCREPSDHWATLDVLGQDGRYVSVLAESDVGHVSCRTWDVELGRTVTLEEYDARHAEKRLLHAARRLRRHPLPGTLDPQAFVVRGGHVAFCLFDEAGRRRELPVP